MRDCINLNYREAQVLISFYEYINGLTFLTFIPDDFAAYDKLTAVINKLRDVAPP